MKQIILKCYVFFLFILFISSFQIKTFINDTDLSLDVYNVNGTLSNFTYEKTSCCQVKELFIDQSEYDITNFSFFKEENDTFNKDDINITLINNNFDISSHKEVFEMPEHPDIIELQVYNVCLLNQTYYDGNIITVSMKVNDKIIHFSYSKNCHSKGKPYYLIKIVSLAIFLLFIYMIVYITAKYSAKQHFLSNNVLNVQLNSHFIIYWHYGIYIVILSLIGVMSIHFFKEKAINFYSFVITVICFLVTFMGIVYILKKSMKLECFPKRLKENLKQEYFNVKMYKIVSLILSFIILIIFHIFHFMLISNIIFFSFIFGALSLIIIQTFSSLILFTACLITYDIIFLLSTFILNINYNSKYLELIDQPIKFLSPNLFEYNPLHPCFFSSCIDILVISLIVKYARSFDLLKGNTNFKYFHMCLFFLSMGCIATFLLYLIFFNAQILLFPIEIILTLNLILMSIYQGEMNDFMEGKNNIGMRKAVDDIIHSVEKIDEDEGDKDKGTYVRNDSEEE